MIVDAILGLSFDDLPSNLAASALFCVLASDVSDANIHAKVQFYSSV